MTPDPRLPLFLAALLATAPAFADGPNGKALPPHAHIPLHASPPDGPALAVPLAHAPAGIARPYSGTPIDVTTYHYEQGRSGWNQAETDLTQASVGSAKFGLLKTLAVDGNVFAQPLIVSGYTMPDGSVHDVLIVATGHNSVYAYDAQSYAVLWHVNLGKPQSTADVGCTDVRPEYGISSTPVIVRSAANAGTLYVVSATEPSRFTFETQLHALDIGTGKDLLTPATISPSATIARGATLNFSAQNQWSRAGLAWANNTIYVSIGSHCDNSSGSISGWMLPFSPTLAAGAPFHTIEHAAGTELASIWMSGFAPAIDASGNILAVTGNGEFDGKHDYGESVLSLSPDVQTVNSTFTPAAYAQLNAADLDFASGGDHAGAGVLGADLAAAGGDDRQGRGAVPARPDQARRQA